MKQENNNEKAPTMGETSGAHVCDLVTQHWPFIMTILEKSGKGSVGVSLKFKRVANNTYNLRTSIRFADKHSDEREDTVGEDPNQEKLHLGDLKK